jgi:uncharacterized protein
VFETPLFFSGRHSQLFGVFHDANRQANALPFVFCHPFGEEKLWAHRVAVTFARALAARGHHVLRFDYMGNGDSDGEFSASSVETALADIASAVDYVKTRTGHDRVALLGTRLGATFASLVAEQRQDVSALLLWAPIVDCNRYMRDLLRINLTTQMAVYREIRADRDQMVAALRAGHTINIDGYEISLPMFEQLSALHLGTRSQPLRARTLIVQCDRVAGAPLSAELERLKGRATDATLLQVAEDPFWTEIDRVYDSAPNLFPATLGWLEQ